MKKPLVAVASACVVALALASSLAWAGNTATVEIPFSFMLKDIVKDNKMPPGTYEVMPDPADMTRLVIRSKDGSHSMKVSIMERLADIGATQPKFVFNRIGTTNYLSEVHMPGQDGYLVFVAKGNEQHTHVTVSGKE